MLCHCFEEFAILDSGSNSTSHMRLIAIACLKRLVEFKLFHVVCPDTVHVSKDDFRSHDCRLTSTYPRLPYAELFTVLVQIKNISSGC